VIEGTLIDITERKRMETALRRAKNATARSAGSMKIEEELQTRGAPVPAEPGTHMLELGQHFGGSILISARGNDRRRLWAGDKRAPIS